MDFSQKQRDPAKRAAGIGLVVLLHIALIYALINGLARKVVEVVKPPLETKIIQNIKPPPPPPPPPPPLAIPPPEVVTTPPPVTATTAPTPPPPPRVVAPAAAAPYTPTVQKGSCTPPEYPAASEQAGEAGRVVLALLIGPDGKVLSSKVDTTSGFPRLDRAAVQALSLCHFSPPMVDGKPGQAWGRLAYVFKEAD